MTDMREKLVAAMTKRETEFGRSMTPIEIAQGVIAALPDMIEPLEWLETTNGFVSPPGYEICTAAGSRGRYVLVDPDGRLIVAPAEALLRLNPYSGSDLMEIANIDHRKQVMKEFGVEV